MRIDAHHHVWDLDVRPQPWTASTPPLARSFSFDELRPSLIASRIDATVVVQTVTVAEETPELLDLASRESVVAGVVGWVDFTTPDVFDNLAALRSGPNGRYLVGIRHQVQEEVESDWLAGASVLDGLRAVAAHGLTYDLVVRREQLPSARKAAKAVPELRFVLDHGGNPAIEQREVEPWSTDVAAFAALPNTAVKLSGLVTSAGAQWSLDHLRFYVDHLLAAFGAGRILFGSDWPVCLLHTSYERVVEIAEALTVELNSSERAAVFGANAAAWYGLEVT
jgi:L-fucono-1,5-lactonase